MLLCLQKNGNMLANKRRNNRITKKVCGVFRVIPERIAFEITQFKGVIPAKSTVIAAVDLRMVPLSPTGTALESTPRCSRCLYALWATGTALRAARRVGLRGATPFQV